MSRPSTPIKVSQPDRLTPSEVKARERVAAFNATIEKCPNHYRQKSDEYEALEIFKCKLGNKCNYKSCPIRK